MNRRQVLALCSCNMVIYAGISGMIGLMPVYLAQLGASSTVTGFFLAFAYLSLATSNVLGGRLADRLQCRRRLLILGGALAVPLAWLMSQATAIVALLLLIGCLWFVTGIAMTMVTILVGLSSAKGSRGGVYGILGLSSSLGLLLGSLYSGRIVDAWGFPALFVVLGVQYALIPLAGLGVRECSAPQLPRDAARDGVRSILSARPFLLLFLGSILAQAANVMIFLSRTLRMHTLHFDATTMSTTAALGLAVTLPLPLLVGWLSDRLGRKPLIIACFLTTAPGLIVLAVAVAPWQFWLASALQTMLGQSIVPGSALITDSLPQEALGTGLALLNATPWIGIVLGLSGGGMAISAFQMTPTLLLSALLSLLATLVLVPIPAHTHHRSAYERGWHAPTRSTKPGRAHPSSAGAGQRPD